MLVEYNLQKVFTGAIEVNDAGNFCLVAESEDGSAYYIFAKSSFGKISIMKAGPFLDDLETFLDNFEIVYKKFDFKEAAISKEINTVVNDPRKKIIKVTEIEINDGLKILPDIAQTFILSSNDE